MPAKSVKILLLLAFIIGFHFSVSAQQPSASEVKNAFNLYEQHQYLAAANIFEHLIQTGPNARFCYYGALANRASNKEMRARQLFQYLVTNYPNTQEAIYAQKALSQGQALAVSSTPGNSQKLPDSIIRALPPDMQALLSTPTGKQAVQQALKEHASQVTVIQKAEQQGLLNQESVTTSTQSAVTAYRSHLDPDHPFTAEDIAKIGAAGIDQSRYPNCWFEASMSALAQLPRGQRLLASMIRCQGSDTYVVRFHNDGVEYIIPQSYLAQYGIRDNALWASIIECAQLKKYPDNQGANGADNDQSRLEIGLGCITGAKAEVISPSSCSIQELSSFIDSAIKSQNPIVAATYGVSQMTGLPMIVVPNHAYSIIGFDASKNMILLRNPHGHKARRFQLGSDPQHLDFEQLDNGVFKLSLPLFQKYYHSVARSFI